MAGTGEIRYLTIRPSHANVAVDANVVSAHHQSLNVFIPISGFYSPNALTFGDFLARTGPVDILEQTLQLVGELSNRVATYGTPASQTVRFGGAMFERILAFIVKITNPHGETVGRLLRVFWAKMSLDVEDQDLENRADGPKKSAEIAKRERQRDVNKCLEAMMAPKKKEDEKEESKEQKFAPRFWYHNMDRKRFMHHYVAKLTAAEPQQFHGLGHADQPANIHNLLHIEVAMREMHAAGASQIFYDPMTWADNNINVPASNVWKVQPTELHWTFLAEACFPDIPRPVVDKDGPEFTAHYDRFLRGLLKAYEVQFQLADEGADEERKRQVEQANGHLLGELQARASRHTEFVMQSLSSTQHELSNHDTFRAATKALFEREKVKAGEDPIRRAQAVLRIQRQQLQKFDIFLRRSQVLTESYVAIRDYLQKYLDTHNNTFWREVQRPAHFSNLTEFGAFVAMMPLEQEAVFENYNVHRHAITVHLASKHVYFTHAPIHVWTFLTGDPKAGKSFTGRQALLFIEGTVRESQGQTEKAKMESGNGGARYYGFQIKLEEELPPTALGLDGLHGKNLKTAKSSNAMSDVASRVRHSATSHTVTWDRLRPNPSTGRFEAEHIKYTLHETIIGAINLPAHLFPENMKSRAMMLEYVQRMRTSGLTLTHRMLYGKPAEYAGLKDSTRDKMRLGQGLLAMAAMLMDLGIISPPKMTAAKGFIDEVIELASKCGITGVSDVRHLQRITGIMEVLCVLFAQWSFYTDPKSAAKGMPHSWEHFLVQEKDFSISIEQAVFVLTLCEEQFEPPLSSEVLAAIKRTWTIGPMPGQIPEDYSQFDLGNPADDRKMGGGGGAGEHSGSKTYWCSKLYAAITDKMEFRPPREAGVNYLEDLCDTQVTTADGRRIDALKFDSTGRCSIANALLQGGRKDRFLRRVQEVLCRPHYPRQRYVLGRLDPDAPFIWLTFSNNPDDLPTPEERDLYEKLTKIAEETRRHDLQLEGKHADDPEWANRVVSYRYASHEKKIWDTLLQHHGNHDAIEAAFLNSVFTPDGLVLVDNDREDDGMIEDWESRGVTKETWSDLLSDNKATPQLPSARRQAYAAEIKELARRECGERGDQNKLLYPTCFESRDQKAYFREALQRAKSDPYKFCTSVRAQKRLELMGLARTDLQQQQQQQQDDRKPPPDPPAPQQSRETKRTALSSLGQQQQQPSRKRRREDQEEEEEQKEGHPSAAAGRFAFLRSPAAAARPAAAVAARAASPPGIGDMLKEIFGEEADATTESKENAPAAGAAADGGMEQRARELAEAVPDNEQPPPRKKPKLDQNKKKKKKKKEKTRMAESEHSDDGEDLERAFQERAEALGWTGEVGGPVTGETEDDEPPEVDSESDMVSSNKQIRWEEERSRLLADQEDDEAAKDAEDIV